MSLYSGPAYPENHSFPLPMWGQTGRHDPCVTGWDDCTVGTMPRGSSRYLFIAWHFHLFPTKHAEVSKCCVMLFAMAMGVKRVLAKPTRKNRGRIGEFKQSDSQWSTDLIGGLAVRGASQGPRVTACHEAYVQGRSSQGQRSRQLSPSPVARNLRSQKQNRAKKKDVK